MATFKKYVIMQALSGALFTAIPLLVAILTFTAYIASGHVLDVATALTSLALFDILRFPLFMLPNMLNNCVEAKVSLDRVQSYLLEEEKENIPSLPLKEFGILLSKATLVWNAKNKNKKSADSTTSTTETSSFWNRCYQRYLTCKDFLSGM
jgi:ATP-binding cassette subfamily C (CFTR/MRP) protein 1